MTIDNQTLGMLLAEIEGEFQNDPDITITPVAGDPPNEYEITFHIPCTSRDEHGNIEITHAHVVGMSIPFGFPHFPPSCKPKSPIFHPDFDDAAICLGDFWNKTPSLPGLIRHLKAMIGGEIYSIDNAFNTRAAEWFRNNQSTLPFSKQGGAPPAPAALIQPGETDQELSVVVESDFADDFSSQDEGFELPQAAPDQDTSSPWPGTVLSHSSSPASAFDLERLNLLASKRHYQELDAALSALPNAAASPELGQLQQSTQTAIHNASILHQQAARLRQLGQLTEALACLQSVEKLVADFPNILEEICALEEALEAEPGPQTVPPGQDLPDAPVEPPPVRPAAEADSLHLGSNLPKPGAASKKKRAKKKRKVSLPRPGRPLSYGLAGLTALTAVLGGYVVFHDNSKLDSGQSLYKQCTTALDSGQFRKAQSSCLDAQRAGDAIFFLHQEKIAKLTRQIQSTLSSQPLQQGLKGKVLFNGRYVPKASVDQLQELLDAVATGTAAFAASDWQEAEVKLKRAVELNSTLKSLNEEEHTRFVEQAAYASFMKDLTALEALLTKGDAIEPDTITSLKDTLQTLPPRKAAPLQARLDASLAQYQFAALKQQADVLFAQSDWPGAMSLFAKAAEAGKLLSSTEQPDLRDIQKSITRAELYQSIDAGNFNFSSGMWDEAIRNYHQAISILSNNYQLLSGDDYHHSVDKLERIILQTTIIRDRQAAEVLQADGKADEAITKLDSIVARITSSPFARDPEFSELAATTRQSADEMKKEVFLEGRISYLIENYQQLVVKHYSAASEDTISSPAAEFVKQLDSRRYLFKLQCTETGRGRPLTLIMNYTYDSVTDKWEFSSGG